MIVIVCGSRGWSHPDSVFRRIEALKDESDGDVTIVHGGARGPDSMAENAAKMLGLGYRCFLADWNKHGRAAGPIRNQRMLDEMKPDLVIAFWDGKSKGTKDMIDRALAAHVDVEIRTVSHAELVTSQPAQNFRPKL